MNKPKDHTQMPSRKQTKLRFCLDCGILQRPQTLAKGKYKGKIYYKKYCDVCCYSRRAQRARDNWKAPIHVQEFAECVVCGTPFEVGRRGGKSRTAKVCSDKCLRKWYSQKAIERDAAKHMNTKEAIAKQALTITGVARIPNGVCKGADNIQGRTFHFTAPNGRDYQGHNITHFTRTHEHLFSKADLGIKEYKPLKGLGTVHRSNASSGLSALSRGANLSWKGWTVTTKHLEDNYRVGAGDQMNKLNAHEAEAMQGGKA